MIIAIVTSTNGDPTDDPNEYSKIFVKLFSQCIGYFWIVMEVLQMVLGLFNFIAIIILYKLMERKR